MSSETTILEKLREYSKQDFSYSKGNIIGSMCTEPLPIAKKAYMDFLETNLGDPELFPGTKKIETKYLKFISKLLNSPHGSQGLISSGGTESNITAMWIAKKKSKKKKIIVPESAHFSFQKVASLMDLTVETVPLNSKYLIDINEVRKKIDDQTAAVVGIAGSTELGTIDPIDKLSKLCQDKHIFLHVDAAFGGYVIPFLKLLDFNVPDFDFKNKGVSSISVDAHKMGSSAIPLGVLMVKKKDWLDRISVESHCVSSKKQSKLLGTRSGGPVAAAYAISRYLGIDGYKKIVKQCMDNTFHTKKRIEEIGLELATQPTMNVLGVKLNNPAQVTKKLTTKGWKVNVMERISCIRLVLMPHVTKQIIDKFIPDLEKTCKELDEI